MNPPYGRGIGEWVDKLRTEYQDGQTSEAIALVPARTDTQWWQMLRDYPVCLVGGRLRFGDAENAAPFPSAVFYLGENIGNFYHTFSGLGDIWQRVEPFSFGE
jgi:site-specific DNA-methyltransferase (adenine-specific)